MSDKAAKALEHSVTNVDILEVGEDAALGETPLAQGSFSVLSAFGFAFAVLNSWCVLVVGLGSGLASGGPSALFWGFIYAIMCNLCMTLSLAEPFAVYPTAGGQYHWAAILAPPNHKAMISWITGLTNMAGLWTGISTQAFLAAMLYTTVARVINPEWTPTPSQSYAIYLAVIVLGALTLLAAGTRLNRWVDTAMMIGSLLGVVVIIVTLFATMGEKASASQVFFGLNNVSGWDSMAIAWLLGLLQSAFSFIGFDLVFHISEEMQNPKRDGPRVLHATIIIGGISGIVVLLCLLFAAKDIDALLGSVYGLPFAQIIYNATQSKAATCIFLLIPALLFSYGSRGCMATVARVMMSLGRDGALPAPSVFQVIQGGEPIWGLVVSALVAGAAGAVQLGSTAAFSSLLGTAVILLQISYIVPVILMLTGGRKHLNSVAPDRLSNLGRWGVPCNLIAIFFVVQSCVVYCFPVSMPVTAGNMNYVVAFVGGHFLILALLWIFWAKNRFDGPTETRILDIANRGGVVERYD